jgi:signal peptide peptidase SppA
MKAWQAICSEAWAIRPEALRLLLAIANREHDVAAWRAQASRLEPDAVRAQDGRPLDGAKRATVRDGIAILPVRGPIVRYADLFSDMSGATSVESLSRDFQVALAAPTVRAILLEVDSPGGQVNGVAELAQLVYAARAKKPIWAYVGDQGASAAYWIASAAERIVAADTALLGSIGVVAAVPDPTKTTARDIEFVSSQSPRKRPDPTTESGRAQLQALVDTLADVFVAAVARQRDVSAQQVLDDFGRGDVLVGQAAVQAGLADQLGTFEDTLAQLARRVEQPPLAARPAAARRQGGAMSFRDKVMQWLGAGAPEEFEAEDAGPRAAGAEAGNPVLPPAATGMAGQGGSNRSAPPAPQGGTPMESQTPTPAPPAPAPAPAPEARTNREAALEAEIARLRAEKITGEAAAFVERYLTAGKAFPAERDAILAVYTQAATDDAYLGAVQQGDGRTTTRVALLRAAFEARPEHQLTLERLPAHVHAALAGLAQSPKPEEQGTDPKTLEELLGMTALGAQHLRERNGQAR